MNFYIGNSIREINPEDKNIVVDEDFIQFIYRQQNQLSFDVRFLCAIDPYNDVVISGGNLNHLIITCQNLLQSTVLDDYSDRNDVVEMLNGIIAICSEAIANNVDIISIGD